MSKIVYILTNQSMPDTIKIGITDNLERRMRELDKTSTPLPFECYYAVEKIGIVSFFVVPFLAYRLIVLLGIIQSEERSN